MGVPKESYSLDVCHQKISYSSLRTVHTIASGATTHARCLLFHPMKVHLKVKGDCSTKHPGLQEEFIGLGIRRNLQDWQVTTSILVSYFRLIILLHS